MSCGWKEQSWIVAMWWRGTPRLPSTELRQSPLMEGEVSAPEPPFPLVCCLGWLLASWISQWCTEYSPSTTFGGDTAIHWVCETTQVPPACMSPAAPSSGHRAGSVG